MTAAITYTQPYSTRRPNLLPWLLLAVVFAAAATSLHALTKHGGTDEIMRCIDQSDPSSLLYFYDPGTGRVLTVCYLSERGEYGLSVDEYDGRWTNITRYVMQRVKSVEQIMRRMTNRGAFQIIKNGDGWTPIP